MISILIPTYNYDVSQLVRSLHDQIESIKRPFELLVYEDGSRLHVDTNKELDSIGEVKHKVFEKNMGRSAIRQRLAKDAAHDLLLFLDADVLPVNENFLSSYVDTLSHNWDVVCGGISYAEGDVDSNKKLRFVYGKAREAKAAAIREQQPHIIVTANILIKRDVFLSINDDLDNFYGEDLLLSQNLQRMNYKVGHIDNPVFHLGLEDSEDYLLKAREAVKNIVRMEGQGKLSDDFTSLQRAYKKARMLGMLPLLRWTVKISANKIRSNLLSKNPALFCFDIFRLSCYAELKKND